MKAIKQQTEATPVDTRTRARKLRDMLYSDQLEFLMEAHNGLSAHIVEEAGFKGIWGSGLAISAQFGVRDNNEASWTQIVDTLEFMSDVTTIPILLDGDTGYGDFNNMRRLVRKLEQRDIAGVCIEDKVFPKTNSFIGGERQELADIGEFSGKIKAGKDCQSDDDFCIVARVEALIAGWGMDEALKRAHAYCEAGADAILIHSKRAHPDEILAFNEAWDGSCPLVIVPTKYYSTPTDVFRSAGISTVIWANHLIRGATATMQSITKQIYTTETLVEVEDQIVPVSELFRLQGADELLEAEQRYAAGKQSARAIVLAASRGDELEPMTADRPKVMLPVAGKPLLRRLVDKFKQQHMDDITVVGGYRADAIDVQGIDVITNSDYENTGELASLDCARESINGDTVVAYGDLLMRGYILRDLLAHESELTIVVDSSPDNSDSRDRVRCSEADDRSLFRQNVIMEQAVAASDQSSGRWIGLLKTQGEGTGWLLEAMDTLRAQADFNTLNMPDLLNQLVKDGHPVNVVYINGHWLDVNTIQDLGDAGEFAGGAHRDSDQ